MSALPPLYAAWMDALLGGPIPEETEATCEDCAMLPGEGSPSRGAEFFHPRAKCCTYLPEVPNFLVGQILSDPEGGRGRATVEARLASGVAVTPLGLGRARASALLYQEGRERVFGRALSLRCPHYLEEEGGRCGIWRHRNGVCATWFCKHVRGAVGLGFWRSLEWLLSLVEQSLARFCVLDLDLGLEALTQLLPPRARALREEPISAEELDGAADPERYPRAWGRWLGEERELYRECARLVAPLSWGEVARIAGPEVGIASRIL